MKLAFSVERPKENLVAAVPDVEIVATALLVTEVNVCAPAVAYARSNCEVYREAVVKSKPN